MEYGERMVRLETEASVTKEDIRDLRVEVRDSFRRCEEHYVELRRMIEQREREVHAENLAHEKARKIDRQWLIGTVLVGSSLVVTALGILMQAHP